MTTTVPPSPYRNAAEWLDDLGDVPLERIMFDPWPGTATEADLLRKIEAEDHLCELINGTLVEKPAGFYESQVAMVLVQKLLNFILPRGLGAISGEAGPLRLAKGLVRLTDVAFVSSARLATADVRNQPIPSIAPDLAIEVLSKSNTRKEIEGKTREYFKAGTRLVWIVDPLSRSAVVHTSMEKSEEVRPDGTLDGQEVLPGFALSLAELFATVDQLLGLK